jgi:ribose 5-phosphate isomerase B
MSLRIAIACDHGGFDLKRHLQQKMAQDGLDVLDLGINTRESIDYPDKAHALASVILKGQADLGILICGTGIGISIAANRHRGIRAALCTDPFMARMSREHNDANVLCLGGRVVGPSLAEEILAAFLRASFQGGHHERRLEKIEIT